MSKGVEALGNVLFEQMKGVSQYGNRNAAVQLGRITSGLGLKLDNVGYTIPKSDYMISRSAMLPTQNLKTETADGHTHNMKMPTCFRPIQSGDRVLVAMVGTEPIVIDIVVPANSGAFGG